jgi:hypothetical protein
MRRAQRMEKRKVRPEKTQIDVFISMKRIIIVIPTKMR